MAVSAPVEPVSTVRSSLVPDVGAVSLAVERRRSKNSDRDYFALVLDLGYAVKILSYDTNLCAEALGVTVRDLQIKTVDGERYVIACHQV